MVQALTEKLELTGPAEKKRVVSVPQRESSWQVAKSCLFLIEKEQSCRFRAPDRKVVENQGSESRTLVRERGIRTGAWRKRVDSTVKKAIARTEGGKQEEPP